jgi:hypothetical protein
MTKRSSPGCTARGFDVWWDRASMPARGLTFLHESRDAEWQYAGIYGKTIHSIIRLGDFALALAELKLPHAEDFWDDIRYTFYLENLVRQPLRTRAN